MTDKQKPAPVRAAPTIDVPDLPSSSGAWFGARTQILEKDARFIRAHSDVLDAQASRTNTLFELMAARMRLFRLMAELAALPEACRRLEEHRLRMLALKNEAEATEAAIVLAEARSRLSQVMGGQKQAAPAANDGFLGLEEIEELLQTLPEIAPETLQTLSLMLKGRMKEKRG